MKRIMNWVWKHAGHVVAALALVTATSSISTTCIFEAYQPETPDELC